jgi:hypothetical protein
VIGNYCVRIVLWHVLLSLVPSLRQVPETMMGASRTFWKQQESLTAPIG